MVVAAEISHVREIEVIIKLEGNQQHQRTKLSSEIIGLASEKCQENVTLVGNL